MLDPALEEKDDGIDLFDSTVLLTTSEDAQNELEVIFDLSRESTLPKIYEIIGARKEEDDSWLHIFIFSFCKLSMLKYKFQFTTASKREKV